MVKRKAKELNDGALLDEPRRSSRRISTTKEEANGDKTTTAKTKTAKKAPAKVKKSPIEGNVKEQDATESKQESEEKPAIQNGTPTGKAEPTESGRQYWLMKAEPESRIEKGKDVKFSIDDLAAKKEPEPWDGIRAYPARNNLRSMKKGDLAFFYHSSCKIPAIVGIMEIVEEHSPDQTAHDPSAPYYDPSSKPEDPKWSIVRVSFRQKLQTPITLRDLRAFQAEKGSPLADMQMLRQTRLSVSRVSVAEWRFLVGVMEGNGEGVL